MPIEHLILVNFTFYALVVAAERVAIKADALASNEVTIGLAVGDLYATSILLTEIVTLNADTSIGLSTVLTVLRALLGNACSL